MEFEHLAAVGIAWTLYAGLHSTLAATSVKRAVSSRWPALGRWYRLGYNIIALVTLAPVIAIIDAARGPWLWRWSGPAGWIADALALAAAAAFAWTLRGYDTRDFMGVHPRRDIAPQTEPALVVSAAHRIVRHPWYALALVILWTRDMDAARLASAVLITVYIVVGSRLEESKLIAAHGEAYRRYRQRVPALLPRPWRVLDATQARAIEVQAAARRQPAATPREPDAG